jgi:SAM-dependent methyltransferase
MIAARDAGRELVLRSFRDPAGAVLHYRNRILRTVNDAGAADLEAFLATGVAREAMESGKLIRSVRISPGEFPDLALDTDHLLEHERIPFPSYPYEWPPEMLHAAGALTLELARRGLEAGFGLKDATPYNVLFRGPEPVFVDVLSFERREPRDAAWMAYAQFVSTFLLPLLANRSFGLPVGQILSGRREGLEPETMYRWAGLWRRLVPPFFGLVTLPAWLGRRRKGDPSLYRPKPAASPEQAHFVVDGLLKSCERRLAAVQPGSHNGDSTWSGYLERKSIYTPAQLARKEAFVSEALQVAKPRTVLDVGANEGRFSFLAAQGGASVVAIDSDPVVAGSIWRQASRSHLDVLPLVVDLTRPTPAVGWRNRECASFLERARGSFDVVMMLAVVHHVLVTERIPLDDLLELAGELSREFVLIEFVAPEDPMFQRIVRGREGLYSHLTNGGFEAAARSRFDLVKSVRIEGLYRWLYLFRRRHATS